MVVEECMIFLFRVVSFSLGFCLLVAHGAVGLWEKHKHTKHRHVRWCLILSATALLALLAAKTYTRNSVWKSRETLFW